MAQEEKSLLLQDLCARLPYGVIVQVKDWTTLDAELKTGHIRLLQEDKIELKPYLRPLSSMTEEEFKEYRMFIDYSYNDFTSESTPCVYTNKVNDYIDWLNAHYFDYRGLIEKGLALEAPKNMYSYG